MILCERHAIKEMCCALPITCERMEKEAEEHHCASMLYSVCLYLLHRAVWAGLALSCV